MMLMTIFTSAISTILSPLTSDAAFDEALPSMMLMTKLIPTLSVLVVLLAADRNVERRIAQIDL